MNNWVEEMMAKNEERRIQREEEEKQRLLDASTQVSLIPHTKTPETFDRFAEAYGNIVKEIKRSGRARASAKESGLSSKTFAARLRDVRSAVAELGYKSVHVPDDAVVIMADIVFRELGDWVFCEPRKRKLSSVTTSANAPKFPPFVVSNLVEVEAVLIFLSLKDENGQFQLSDIVLAPTDAALLPEITRLFSPSFSVSILATWVELSRITKTI